jgi:hypothetical protein
MQIVCGRDCFERPAQVRQTERSCACDRRQLVVVDEDDPARAYEPSEEDQVEEDPVEAVVAVDERQVKIPGFAEESRQRGSPKAPRSVRPSPRPPPPRGTAARNPRTSSPGRGRGRRVALPGPCFRAIPRKCGAPRCRSRGQSRSSYSPPRARPIPAAPRPRRRTPRPGRGYEACRPNARRRYRREPGAGSQRAPVAALSLDRDRS